MPPKYDSNVLWIWSMSGLVVTASMLTAVRFAASVVVVTTPEFPVPELPASPLLEPPLPELPEPDVPLGYDVLDDAWSWRLFRTTAVTAVTAPSSRTTA